MVAAIQARPDHTNGVVSPFRGLQINMQYAGGTGPR